jgi:hypothetical protein
MFLSSKLKALVRASCVVIAAAVVLAVVIPSARAQEEERWKVLTTPPENVRPIWYLQTRHVASELELDREAAGQLMRTYYSARQAHLEKVEALPKTQESMRELWQITGEARSSLEKSLVEALGEEKGKKASVALGGFSFFVDHMMADILAAQRKAIAGVLEYQKGVNKVIEEARESGAWEGVREKMKPLVVELGKQATLIYSEQQLAEWQEKYGWFFERILSE